MFRRVLVVFGLCASVAGAVALGVGEAGATSVPAVCSWSLAQSAGGAVPQGINHVQCSGLGSGVQSLGIVDGNVIQFVNAEGGGALPDSFSLDGQLQPDGAGGYALRSGPVFMAPLEWGGSYQPGGAVFDSSGNYVVFVNGGLFRSFASASTPYDSTADASSLSPGGGVYAAVLGSVLGLLVLFWAVVWVRRLLRGR